MFGFAMNRVTSLAAILALVLALIATVYCAVTSGYAFESTDTGFNWLPLAYLLSMNAYCLYAAWVLGAQLPDPFLRRSVWISQGLFLGFVVAGSWSIGLFFAPSWLIVTALALVDLERSRPSLMLATALIVLMLALAATQTAVLVAAPGIMSSLTPTSGMMPARPATVTR
jgi:hypothetical protein